MDKPIKKMLRLTVCVANTKENRELMQEAYEESLSIMQDSEGPLGIIKLDKVKTTDMHIKRETI